MESIFLKSSLNFEDFIDNVDEFLESEKNEEKLNQIKNFSKQLIQKLENSLDKDENFQSKIDFNKNVKNEKNKIVNGKNCNKIEDKDNKKSENYGIKVYNEEIKENISENEFKIKKKSNENEFIIKINNEIDEKSKDIKSDNKIEDFSNKKKN